MIFKCKNCGGNAVYSPEKHGMYCPFCDSENSAEKKAAPEGEMSICPNCGGEIPVLEHTAATRCPYCDNYLIFEERIEGVFEPKLMIPFQFGKEKCKESIRENFKKYIFAPSDFLSEARLNRMQGEYVPFWFYDYHVKCDFCGEGTKVKSWTSGNRQYTETSYYQLYRNMDVYFENVPVDASVSMADDVMDLLEPYQYEEIQEFRPEFLSGFYAEKYNMSSDLVEFRAKQKMEEDAGQLISESCGGYSRVTAQKKDVNTLEETERYGLLPVWKYIYKYHDKEYPFYVNGQNGKIVGEVPLSKKKMWVYTGTLWAVLTIILGAAGGILSLLQM